MARPRKSVATLKLEGGYRKDRHAKQMELPASIPNAPTWLDKEAAAEWKRVVPSLAKMGTLNEIDRGTLAGMCTNWSIFHQLSKRVAELTNLQQADLEFSRVSTAMQSAWSAYSKAAREFGITPSARVGMPSLQKKEVSKLDKYFG